MRILFLVREDPQLAAEILHFGKSLFDQLEEMHHIGEYKHGPLWTTD